MQEEDAPNTFNLLNGKSLPIFISKQVILFNWHFGIQVSEKVYCVQKIIRVQQLWARRSARREKCKKVIRLVRWTEDEWLLRSTDSAWGDELGSNAKNRPHPLCLRASRDYNYFSEFSDKWRILKRILVRVSMEINCMFYPANFPVYWHPRVSPVSAHCWDNDDAWAGARQLSARAGARGLSTRSQVPEPRLRQDTLRGQACCSPEFGTNRYGSSGSDTLTDSGSGPRYKLHLAPVPQSQPARVLLHISGSGGEMSASGSGGSGATQPEPLQSLLSLSSEPLWAELLLTLLVAGPRQESRRSFLNIDEEATHYSGCLNTEQWPHLLFVIVGDSYHMSSLSDQESLWKHGH